MADRHPEIPEDEVVLDWFAGATLTSTPGAAIERTAFWEGAEAALAFSDIGLFGGDPRAQIVLYALHHDPTIDSLAVSLEIDREDARKLARLLNRWADKADDLKEEQE